MEQDSKFQANNSLENNSQGKVPFISKLAYGMGDVGCNFSWMFVGNFLMIFYTDVFGISMSAVATLMLVSRFWDAINDPIIGTLTDKTHTRWGRFRPWLLFGAPITALVLILTFWAHPEWSQTAKIIYMAVTYCILVLGYTCVNLPYGTLCGAMTQDIDERAKLNTSRSVSAMMAIGVINIVTVPLISWFGAGDTKYGYLAVAVLYGIIFAACHQFLLPQDQGSGRSSCGTEAPFKGAASFRDEEQALSARPLRTVALRFHPLRTQRRHALLFHLCRRFGNALLLLFHGHHRAKHHRCSLLPSGIQKNGQQGFHGSYLRFPHRYYDDRSVLLQP